MLGLVLMSIFAPFLAPHDPNETDWRLALKGPSKEFPFGTDEFGRCMMSRVIWGGRISLPFSALALGVAIISGVPFGLAAGYFRKIDNLLMRFVDVLMAFPGILLAISIVAILGTGMNNATIAVGIGTMPAFARLVRSMVLSIREAPFVEASVISGASNLRVITRHILPNCVPTIIVYSMLQMAWIIMSLSTLSFLGIGAAPPSPEWGALVSSGKDYLLRAPHISTFPVFFIFATVIAFNLVGEGLRDELDPRM